MGSESGVVFRPCRTRERKHMYEDPGNGVGQEQKRTTAREEEDDVEWQVRHTERQLANTRMLQLSTYSAYCESVVTGAHTRRRELRAEFAVA